MKKIPSIFIRNPENMRFASTEKNPVCEWVFNGEGIATQKYDGTCCKIEDGKFYKRRMVKRSAVEDGNTPVGFIEEDYDPKTEKYFGWVPVNPDDPADKYHMGAVDGEKWLGNIPDGTYELCGPAINGNPEGFDTHYLVPHSEADLFDDCPRDFESLEEWFVGRDIEGIVFHHPDGRMGKIKQSDFGLKRRLK